MMLKGDRSTLSLLTFLTSILGLAPVHLVTADAFPLVRATSGHSTVPYVEFFEDQSGTLPVEAVARENSWKGAVNKSMSFSFRQSAMWFRLSIVGPPQGDQWLLEVPYALIDHVDVFIPTNTPEGGFLRKTSGRLHPFASRSLDSKSINFTLPPITETTTIYVRMQSESSLICEMRLWAKDDFSAKDSRENLIYGLYFGALFIMALYNLSLYFSIRDSSYLLYFFYVVAFILFQFWLSGFAFQHFLPSFPEIFKRSQPLVMGSAIVLAVLFSLHFLRLRAHAPRLFVLIGVVLTLCIFVLSYGVFDYSIFLRFGPQIVIVLLFLLLIGAAYTLKAGYRPARYYLIAWGGLLIAGIIWTMGRLDIITVSTLTEVIVPFGSAFEVLLLSLALGDRINLMKEEKEAAQQETLERQVVLTQSYARFVPDQMFSLLHKDDVTQVSLGDATQTEITILFSDIRSFTTLSESMTPQENFDFLNAIMKRTGPVIRENHGFVDKFIGDAIMALFPRSPEDAIQAAIQMKLNLRVYNARRTGKGLDPLKVGIGINTGSVILGTVGEPQRMDATVISDTVNLASRIEGLTKYYDAALLVTEQTLFRLSDPMKYKYRMLERVQVKGKQEPVAVFEIFDGDSPEEVSLKIATQKSFEHGVQHHLNQEFKEAIALFKKVLDINPADGAARLYLQRSEHYDKHGAPPDWEGVAVMESK